MAKPDEPIASGGGVHIFITLAEPHLFLHGFSSSEQHERPPTLLRGSLILDIKKPTKIKSVTLNFRVLGRTEWPEGIPPRKSDTYEQNELMSHVWPYFNASFESSEFSSGAHMFTPYDELTSSNSLEHSSRNDSSSSMLSVTSSASSIRSQSAERSVKGLASKLRRAASPSPARGSRSSSLSSFPSQVDLSGLSPSMSAPHDENVDHSVHQKGFRTFAAGEYVYNFELPITQTLPESCDAHFGSVRYVLEPVVERYGTFKSNLSGTKDVKVVRELADNNTEMSEPIAISRDWEDQLHYEIVIAGKAFPIGSCIPIAFKLVPLAKVKLHRIRVYVTENSEYYCRKKRVHRIEPTRKFMLKEFISKDGLQGNLLEELQTFAGPADMSTCSELEAHVEIPETYGARKQPIHPNTSYENIKIHHWIKIVLRLSREEPGVEKRKHFEISIDSVLHILDKRCNSNNIYLPAYHRSNSISNEGSPMLAFADGPPIDDALERPIHLLRRPSTGPPTFEESVADNYQTIPAGPPPMYDNALLQSSQTYSSRFAIYQKQIRDQEGRRSSGPSSVGETLRDAEQPQHVTRSRGATVTSQVSSDESLNSTDSADTVTSLSGEPRGEQVQEHVDGNELEDDEDDDTPGEANNGSQRIVHRQNSLAPSVTESIDMTDPRMLGENMRTERFSINNEQDRRGKVSTFSGREVSEGEEGRGRSGASNSANSNTAALATSSNRRSSSAHSSIQAESPTGSIMYRESMDSADRSPLLGIKDADMVPLTPLDSAGDIGLGLPDDDTASLASTPSLWIM